MSATCNCCGDDGWQYLFEENRFRLGVCPTCHLHYLGNPPTTQQRMTEMEAGHFAGSLSVNSAKSQAASESALAERFRQYVALGQRLAPRGRWLDVGCGTGLLLQFSTAAGYEVEGVELTADRRDATAAQGFRVHGKPIEDLHFDDDTFDVISLINVFSHLTDPSRTFAELERILKPDGIAIVVTGEVGAGVRRGHMARWNLGDHLYFLGEGTMRRYADAARLLIVNEQRTWLPAEMYSRSWLRTRGLSKRRDAIKAAIDKAPGAYPLYRRMMLSRSRGNPIYTVIYALSPGSSADPASS